ncbi:MAG: hypothetical protein JXB50_12260 [Spirochaetes bacterium]|nr:hypothetical protein [Spirochaetota bacterium]
MDIGEKSVITAAKDLLSGIIKNIYGKNFAVVKNSVDEANEKNKRTNNFVSVLTADGSFDERSIKTKKYSTEEGLYKIEIRGLRKIPLEIRVYGKVEEETDEILENILSYLPGQWQIGQRQGTIDIMTEHSNDYASNYKDGAMQTCFVLFSMEIGKAPVQVPTIPSGTLINGGITDE